MLSIGRLTGDWTLKTVELNGRNLADDPIDVRHGETLTGVRVVLTNRPTQTRGVLLDEKKQPAEGTVVVFPKRRRVGARIHAPSGRPGRINAESSRSRDCQRGSI